MASLELWAMAEGDMSLDHPDLAEDDAMAIWSCVRATWAEVCL